MKRLTHFMLSGLLLALPLVSATAYLQSKEAITEGDVLAIVNSVDRASRKGNVAAIVAPLASDVKIKVTISSPVSKREQVFTFTKEQYTFHTRRGMRQRLAYQLVRKNTRVKIYDEGKTAMVTSDVYENLTVQQGTLRAVTSEVAMLSLRDGKIVVTSLEGKTRFY